MKTLGIFRHAKSDWNDARLRDFDRPLNKRGRKGAAIMGLHIREHGVRFTHFEDNDVVRHSLVQRIVKAYDTHARQQQMHLTLTDGMDAPAEVTPGLKTMQ